MVYTWYSDMNDHARTWHQGTPAGNERMYFSWYVCLLLGVVFEDKRPAAAAAAVVHIERQSPSHKDQQVSCAVPHLVLLLRI